MTTKTGLLIAMFGAGFALASCASNPAPEPKLASDETSESDADQAADKTVKTEVQSGVSGYQSGENACAEQECSTLGTECCAGYSCGFDPDKSRVQRYCLPE